MPTLIAAICSVALSGAGQLLLRRGAMAAPPLDGARLAEAQLWLGLLLNGWIAAGLLAWALATVLWIVVLNRAPLSYVYLLGSLNYLVVPLLSHWLFAEPLARLQLVGMVVIALGVFLTLAGRAGGLSGE